MHEPLSVPSSVSGISVHGCLAGTVAPTRAEAPGPSQSTAQAAGPSNPPTNSTGKS